MGSIKKEEYWRKSVHLSGIFLIPVMMWNHYLASSLVLLFLVAYLLVEVSAKKNVRIPLLSLITEKSKRDFEKGHYSWGAIGLASSAIILPLILGPVPAAIGLIQTFIADTLAAFSGMLWGKKKLPFNPGKSWVGSLVFLSVGTLVSAYFVSWPLAFLFGFIGMLAESIPIRAIDNILIPAAVGIAAYIVL